MVKVILELEPTQFEVLSRLIAAEHTRITNHDSYPCDVSHSARDVYADVVGSLDDLTAFPFESESKKAV